MQQTAHYKRVRKFMEEAGQAMPEQPTVPGGKTRRLRAKLILEEALETIEALGIDLRLEASEDTGKLSAERFRFSESEEGPDLKEIADGCGDLSVVATGTLVACGIEDAPLLEEIDRANLRKFSSGHSLSEDGKVLKSGTFEEPDVQRVIENQMD
jgi:predicted HAD superfamily Cof-like phosphohydrolase